MPFFTKQVLFLFLDVHTTLAIYAIWLNVQNAFPNIEQKDCMPSWIDFVVIHIVSA